MSEFKQIEKSPYLARSWLSGTEKDADYELTEQSSLSDLRRISQRLIKQNFIAAGAQQAYVNTIVGGDLVVNVLGRPDIDQLLKKELKYVDLDQTQSLGEMLARVVSSVFASGDILITMPYDKETDASYVDLIEASRIRTPPNKINDGSIRQGIKYKKNKITGAHIRSLVTSPLNSRSLYKDNVNDYKYHPMIKEGRKVAHFFRAPLNLRPNQTRQYPIMTPILNMLRYIDSLLEYTLIGTMVAASFSVFIRSKNPAGTKKSLESQNKTGIESVGQLSPGQVWYLNGASESIEFASPNKPSDNTDQFLRRLFRMVSMTLRMPYETLFLDLGEANYASFKSGLLEVKRMKKRWDTALIPVAEWIIRTKLQELWSKGMINVEPNSLDLDIQMPKLGIIDEEKESRANRLDINDTKIKSQRQAINDSGADYDVVQAQITEEALLAVDRQAKVLVKQKKLEEKHGISFNPDGEDGEEFDPSSEEAKEERKSGGNW